VLRCDDISEIVQRVENLATQMDFDS